MAKTKAPELSVRDIAHRLADHTEAVVSDLRIVGTKQGRRFMTASGFRAKGTQVSIVLSGERAGRWKDFAKDIGGDLIDLIIAAEGLSKGDAVKWAKRFLGLDDGPRMKGRTRRVDTSAIEEERHRQRVEDEQARKKKIGIAREIWLNTEPGQGTLVEAYLRGRGIDLSAAGLPWPPALRFAPMCKRWKPHFEVLPAMIAGVQDPDGAFLTVHATWIEAHGVRGMTRNHILELGPDTPAWAADLDPKKLVRGPYTGGAIRLTPARRTLAIGEGNETSLSAYVTKPKWGVWSGISISNIGNILIPDGVERLVILGDGDSSPQRDESGNPVLDERGNPIIPADLALAKAARTQKAAAVDRGIDRTVEIIKAPAGVDFNDLLQD